MYTSKYTRNVSSCHSCNIQGRAFRMTFIILLYDRPVFFRTSPLILLCLTFQIYEFLNTSKILIFKEPLIWKTNKQTPRKTPSSSQIVTVPLPLNSQLLETHTSKVQYTHFGELVHMPNSRFWNARGSLDFSLCSFIAIFLYQEIG